MHLAGEPNGSDVCPLPGRLPAECGTDFRKGRPPRLRMLLRPAGPAAQGRHRLGALGDNALARIDEERLHIGGPDIRAKVIRHKRENAMVRRVRGGSLHAKRGQSWTFVRTTKEALDKIPIIE